MNNKTVHIISHTHWDREWYMPFEKFRIRLVQLMDRTLELLESEESGFGFFHLDGHVLLVDDYLEIRPEQEERVRRLIRDGRLFIGPWYVLQDAFLTSGEAQVRNLQLGISRAKQLGGATMVGYFPDTFGNISQSAQLLKEFGIEEAVFGRGINAVAENNTVIADSKAGGTNSEIWWKSPDGSRVFAVFLANWYHNGMELPTNPDEARVRAQTMLAGVEKFATTPHLLLMNGCDHQPVQADVGEAIRVLNEAMPDYRFVHSHFPQYLSQVREQPYERKTVGGELTSEYTDGWSTLVNTASSRLYLKQWNASVQTELERWVEPFAAIAWMLGDPYPDAFVRHAWKLLLQNHPHDSICGCSVDEVHEEMLTRFRKANQIAETLSGKALESIAFKVNTTAVLPEWTTGMDEIASAIESAIGYSFIPLVVFNPLGWERDDRVEVSVDTDAEIPLGEYRLYDDQGREVPFEWHDIGWVHGFSLPDDRFRISWKKRRYAVQFWAQGLPAIGHATFVLKHIGKTADVAKAPRGAEDAARVSCEVTGDRAVLENAHLRVEAHEDGSLDVLHKETGKKYRGLLIIEDTGDIGNEYTYIAAEKSKPVTTRGRKASLEVVPSDLFAALRIVHQLELPAEREGRGRSRQKKRMRLETVLRLGPNARRIEVEMSGDNQIKDHRLRVLFPTDLKTEHGFADAPFDVIRRNIRPWSGWTNPSRCERMQTFFDVSDGQHGLAIAAVGLSEYEVLRDERTTMALTLLRCVGELGDWNCFPTPGAQCQGPFTARFSIIPHGGDYRESITEAHDFAVPLRAVQTGVHEGNVAPNVSWLGVSSPSVLVTALQKAETFDGVLLRFVNLSEEAEPVRLSGEWVRSAGSVTVRRMDEAVADQPEAVIGTEMTIPGKRIITLGLTRGEGLSGGETEA